MTSGSTMLGTAQPPEPMRRRSMVSPLSTMVIGPTMEPLVSAWTPEFLAQAADGDLDVLDDRVALGLLVEDEFLAGLPSRV